MEINGKKVVDATKAVTINITNRDVTDGDNKNPSGCAAARAAKRDIPSAINARVHIGRVYIEKPDKWVRFETPHALRTEIIAFDRGGSFEPGEYKLTPPSATIAQRAAYRLRISRSGSNTSRNRGEHPAKRPRKALVVAKVKRHEVTGIRPKGANR